MTSLTPKTCSMIIKITKGGKGGENGLLHVRWKIRTFATIYYVWTGKRYQFLDFGKLYTLVKATIGRWHEDPDYNGVKEQENKIRDLFAKKYFTIKP